MTTRRWHRRAFARSSNQALLGWERFRASQFGITHYCTFALNPKEANNPKLAEDEYFAAQLDLARTIDPPALLCAHEA